MPLAVVVRDAHGRIVDNLTRDDFEVLDRGVPQTLASFSVERHSAPAGPSAGSAGPAAPATPATPRTVAFFFDDLDSSFIFGNIQHARKVALAFLGAGLSPGERVGVFTASGEHEVSFTADAAALQRAVAAIQPVTRVARPCALRLYGQPPHEIQYDYLAYLAAVQGDKLSALWLSFFCNDAEFLSLASLDAGRQIAKDYWARIESQSRGILTSVDHTITLLGAQPGEHVLLLSGSGFVADTLRDQEAKVEEDAVARSVTVNVLDTDGVPEQSNEVPDGLDERATMTAMMTDITADTGGTFYRDPRQLGPGMQALARGPEVVYLMSFSPARLIADGHFHPIKVRLRSDPAAEIQTRDGYNAPPPEANPSSRELNRGLNEAALADTDKTDIPATVAVTATARSGKTPAKLNLRIAVDARKLGWTDVGGRSFEQLTFAAVLSRPNGAYATGEISDVTMLLHKKSREQVEKTGFDGEMHIPVLAGAYRLRVVVMESVHGRISSFTRTVVVP